jgi:glycosyltransferase involved in cell wall biosynthesis
MRITFVGPLVSTFVKNDLDILSRCHSVHALDVNLGKGIPGALRLGLLHIRILISMFHSDALFFWFADYHSLIPSLLARIMGKSVFIVAGGFDITYIPELGIGARTRPIRWFAVRNSFKLASHIFTVSNDTARDLDSALPSHPQSTMIYNAVDCSVYAFSSKDRKDVALTVSQADSIAEFKRKGIDTFLRIAGEMGDLQFHIVGIRGEALAEARRIATTLNNVRIIPGRAPLGQVIEEFQQSGAYCQFSIEERFGVSVAEAMSCGCIPVVTPVNAVLEVVGDAGIVVPHTDIAAMVAGVRLALTATVEDRRNCSLAAQKFDIENRACALLSALKE